MTDDARKITTCEVCNSPALVPVLDLGYQAVCDELVPIGSQIAPTRYPIEIAFCNTCQTCHQLYQPPKEHLFPPTYHYRARNTPSVIAFMAKFAAEVNSYTPIGSDSFVIDIGANDGSLLNFFKAYGAKTLGVEPTSASNDCRSMGHETVAGFFDEEIATEIVELHGHPSHVTFTNVFAHIEDLAALIRALSILAGPKTLLIIENHYLGSILATSQFDTFYHEHPRTYSLRSFQYIANHLGRELLYSSFPARYGGNIRVYIGSSQLSEFFPPFTHLEEDFASPLVELSQRVNTWRVSALELIDHLRTKYSLDRIPCKAFPGRAAIILQYLGLDFNIVSAIYEIKGSLKTGCYAPGTRIPILPEADLYRSGYNGPIINLAWHLSDEVRDNLRKNGFTGPVYDIISQEMFSQK